MKINRIYKPKRFDNFTIVPNCVFRTKNISIGATGLYAYLFSHDSSKPITIRFIINHFKEGKDAINSKIKELEKFNLLRRESVKIGGKFAGYNYYLDDQSGLTDAEKTDAENPQQNNINNNNNIDYSEIANKSLEHFINLFPLRYQPKTKSQKNKWLDTLDKIERIDKYDLRKVFRVCQKIRNDNFWSNNFLSLTKLRNNDKNGVKYIHRFMQQFQDKPKCFHKIKGIKDYFIYFDDNEEKLGAMTDKRKLNQFNLENVFNERELTELFNYAKNE
ncbi:MAG: hypothetical protein Unbinned5858contig1001_22 [Prokaryotic dsDNA virus sp.]|nr:MAG: hypothetical protein Unbinned5858contig1001_22 [Prokaryotic dsDNA virus sp.]|tara:strand:- start:6670 stop:7494 length:825 start_codon:yes stop_codon:yes gene_type:complete